MTGSQALNVGCRWIDVSWLGSAALSTVVLLTSLFVTGGGLVVSCLENVNSASARGDVCAVAGEMDATIGWWLVVWTPALVALVVTRALHGRQMWAALLASLAAAAVLDAVLLAIVTSNLFA